MINTRPVLGGLVPDLHSRTILHRSRGLGRLCGVTLVTNVNVRVFSFPIPTKRFCGVHHPHIPLLADIFRSIRALHIPFAARTGTSGSIRRPLPSPTHTHTNLRSASVQEFPCKTRSGGSSSRWWHISEMFAFIFVDFGAS